MKHQSVLSIKFILHVAPYVGAWIETYSQVGIFDEYIVAPYVGAWIETHTYPNSTVKIVSLPTWERGLKH